MKQDKKPAVQMPLWRGQRPAPARMQARQTTIHLATGEGGRRGVGRSCKQQGIVEETTTLHDCVQLNQSGVRRFIYDGPEVVVRRGGAPCLALHLLGARLAEDPTQRNHDVHESAPANEHRADDHEAATARYATYIQHWLRRARRPRWERAGHK